MDRIQRLCDTGERVQRANVIVLMINFVITASF